LAADNNKALLIKSEEKVLMISLRLVAPNEQGFVQVGK
jgi:hypothetical protein